MNHSEAVDLIWRAWQEKSGYPQALRSWLNFENALAIQLALLDRRLDHGDELVGWKIGLTSERVRTHLGTEDQPFGHITRHLKSGSRVVLDDIGANTSIEPEMVVTLGNDLHGPDVTSTSARAAVSHIAAGLEINQNRIGEISDFPMLVADNLTQWAIVEGQPRSLDDSFNSESVTVGFRRNNQLVNEIAGKPEVIDDHFTSLATLANTLGRFNRGLLAGQKIITGSFCRQPVAAGDTWKASFSSIGDVQISFD